MTSRLQVEGHCWTEPLSTVPPCVILTHMRTATVREAQHNLPRILRSVSRGEVVEITRRNRVVARLVPAAPRPVGGLPDFVARARAIWGRRPAGKATSEIVIEARAAGQ